MAARVRSNPLAIGVDDLYPFKCLSGETPPYLAGWKKDPEDLIRGEPHLGRCSVRHPILSFTLIEGTSKLFSSTGLSSALGNSLAIRFD